MEIFINQFFLILIDFFSFLLALFISLLLRFHTSFTAEKFISHLPFFLYMFAIWLFIFYIFGLYDLKNFSKRVQYLKLYIAVIILSFLFSIVFFYIFPYTRIYPKTILLLFTVSFSIINYTLREFFINKSRFTIQPTKILFIGRNKDVDELINYINENPQLGYVVYRVLENFEKEEIDKVITQNYSGIVAIMSNINDESFKLIYEKILNGSKIILFTDLYEAIFNKVPLSSVNEEWFFRNFKRDELYEFLKRIIDVVFALIILIFSLPLWPIIAVCILINSPGSIFFKQERIGRNGKVYILYKFRTMHEVKDKKIEEILIKDGKLDLENKENLSRAFFFGKILRRFHLDELPEMINVIKGDISLVGPRSEFVGLHNFLRDRIPFYSAVTIVKPGLTGWAQINNKHSNNIESAKEKLAYDLYYIKYRSLLFDLLIILKTIKKILSFTGI